MSHHGRLSIEAKVYAADVLNPKWVTRHLGTRKDFLARHRRQAGKVARRGRDELEALAPHLLERVYDERTLRSACDYLQENGGAAPGPDGSHYDDFTESEKWRMCRGLRDEIKAGEYQPGPEKVRHISKGPGRGTRPLVLQNISDRIVQRAAVEILQPLLDPRFDDHSFGYRPKRGPLHALALAEHLCQHERRGVWVVADLRDAFLSVPLNRLLDVVRKRLPADDLVAFIADVTSGATTPGLRQGGPLSPLLLNLYLDHLLDRKWRRLHPDIPLLRFADDIQLMCRTRKEAATAYRDLAKLVREAGMALKEDEIAAVRSLTPEEPALWMGMHIEKGEKGLRYLLTEDAWASLAEKFDLAHDEPNSPICAVESLCGWISAMGPCYPFEDHRTACARIAHLAQALAFNEILTPGEVKDAWQMAHVRWQKLRIGKARQRRQAAGKC